jgi:hypothetical protein
VTVGAGAHLDCQDHSTCTFKAGSGATLSCDDEAHCAISCPGGGCTFQCGKATTCADGRIVCNQTC